MTHAYRFALRLATALSLVAAAACSGPPAGAPVGQTADPLFANGGFEDGTRNNWTLTVKRNTLGLAAVPPTSYAQLQLQNCTLGTNCYDYTYVRSGATPESVPLYGLSAATSPPKLPSLSWTDHFHDLSTGST